MEFRQLAPDLAFAFGDFLWHVDLDNDIEVTALPGDSPQAALAQAKSLATLCPRWNFQAHVAFESWHNQLAAQHRAPRLDLYLVDQVTAFDCEIRMSRQTHAKKKVAAFSSAHTRFALAAASRVAAGTRQVDSNRLRVDRISCVSPDRPAPHRLR